MSIVKIRRTAAVAILAGIVELIGATGLRAAPPKASPNVAKPGSLVSYLQAAGLRWFLEHRRGVDPNGLPTCSLNASQPKEQECTMGPNGRLLCGPSTTTTGDHGCGIDPNGKPDCGQ